jgi:hypothetical protein
MGGPDWAELALVSRVDQWVGAHPHPFIVSTARLVRPTRAAGTVSLPAMRIRDTLVNGREPTQELGRERQREPTGAFRLVDVQHARAPERGARPLVLPLSKVQPTFPSMITVGRTENNDLVVPDEQISKFHAYFRLVGGAVELADAGSRNGTFVAGHRLAPKSESAPLSLRDRFSLGALEFQLFDARGCWEWLRQLDRFA